MCEQCLTWPVSFGHPLKGYVLMRARRQGNDWNKGEWGLIECNDPTFTWKSTPVPIENDWDYPEDFAEGFYGHPQDGYNLVEACMEKGYKPKEDSLFGWLFNYLGKWLETAEPVDEGDAFPNREELFPVDLTIGKEVHSVEK